MADDVQEQIREASDTLTQVDRAADTAGNIASTLGMGALFSGAASGMGMFANEANLQGGQPQAANPSVLSGGTQVVDGKRYFVNPAPKGTRLIIPAHISSTGQERYIGAHVLESITNFHQGNARCANMIIYGANNKASDKFYDFGPNGEIYLKGTKTQIQFDPKDHPVQLSETEYIAILQSLNQNPSDITYFKTTAERGEAENSKASTPSWFSQNWWKILLGILIAGGIAWGGVAFYNNRKEKKAERAASTATTSNQNNEVNTASITQDQSQVTGLANAQNITNPTSSQQNLTNINSNSR